MLSRELRSAVIIQQLRLRVGGIADILTDTHKVAGADAHALDIQGELFLAAVIEHTVAEEVGDIMKRQLV